MNVKEEKQEGGEVIIERRGKKERKERREGSECVSEGERGD